MDIRNLRYFLTVAKEKNITRAAKSLYISQPALSRQLKELEEELNTTLFIRGSRNISLTDEGKYLLNQATEIIALMEKTLSNIGANQDINGEIYIGAAETAGMKYIADIYNTMLDTFPNISLNIFSGDFNEVTEKIESGILDFGVVVEPVQKKNFNYIRLPYKEIWGLLTTKNGIFKNHKNISSSDLEKIPLITSKQSFNDTILLNWLGKSFENLSLKISYNLLYNASHFVKNNIGHAICMDGIINTENTNLKFIPFYPPLQSELSLIWHKNRQLSKAAQKFLDLCNEKYK